LKNLNEACRIDIDDAIVLGQLNAQFDSLGGHGGTIGLHRAADQTAEQDRLPLEHNLA
jgi:hypothetical protein